MSKTRGGLSEVSGLETTESEEEVNLRKIWRSERERDGEDFGPIVSEFVFLCRTRPCSR